MSPSALGHVSGRDPSPSNRVVTLGGGGAAACDEHRPVGEWCRGMSATRFDHVSDLRPSAVGWVIHLGRGAAHYVGRRVLFASAGHHHLAIRQRRRRVSAAARRQAAGGCPSPVIRVVELRCIKGSTCIVITTRDKHFPIGQQCRCMTPPGTQHLPRRGPGAPIRVVQLGQCRGPSIEAIVDEATSNEDSSIGQERSRVMRMGANHLPGRSPRGRGHCRGRRCGGGRRRRARCHRCR